MNCLIVVSLAAVAHAHYAHQFPGPFYRYASPPDASSSPYTPEVAAARAAHLREHAKATAVAVNAYNPFNDYYRNYYYASPPDASSSPYTPEVAAARAAHLREHAKATAVAVNAYNPFNDYYRNYYYASPPDASSSPYTPEVAAARAAHLREHAKATAVAVNAYNPFNDYYRNYYDYPQDQVHYRQLADANNGYPADTPAVAYVKATHLYRHYQASNPSPGYDY